jgi:hypothetical protein
MVAGGLLTAVQAVLFPPSSLPFMNKILDFATNRIRQQTPDSIMAGAGKKAFKAHVLLLLLNANRLMFQFRKRQHLGGGSACCQ